MNAVTAVAGAADDGTRTPGETTTEAERDDSERGPERDSGSEIDLSDGRGSAPVASGVFDRRLDRQVLVVGETVTALTLATLLARAGYDPVLAPGAGPPAVSRVACLWPSGRRALAAVGVGAPVREYGTAIESVSVERVDATGRSDRTLSPVADASTEPLVVVGTERVRRPLEASLPAGVRRLDRAVEAVSPSDGGVDAEFDDGVRERFDVVVDAAGRAGAVRPRGRDSPESVTLSQYETPVDTDAVEPDGVREVWYPDALAQWVPTEGESSYLLRVTTAGDDPAVAGPDRDRTALEATTLPTDLSDVDPTAVRQVPVRRADPVEAWWGEGRVAACGAAACPVAPASGARVSLGVDDALAFVAALTAGGRPAADVTAAYAAGRARRFRTVRRTAAAARTAHDYPVPDATEAPLSGVSLFRTVALGSFLGAGLPSLRRDGSV